MSVKYKLNDWAIVTGGNPYMAPELRRQHLMGKVEGHPDRDDGESIVTSALRGKYEGRIVTGSGSLIELGDPRPDYAAEFPDAKERLLCSATELTLRWNGSIR